MQSFQKITKIISFLLITSLILGTTGCGFHLRKQRVNLQNTLPYAYLERDNMRMVFYQKLVRSLQAANVKILDESEKLSIPNIYLADHQMGQQPLVYGPDGELRRERVSVSYDFGINNFYAEDKHIVLSAKRERQLSSSQKLGDNSELNLILSDLEDQIIEQLLLQLAG